MVCLVHNRQYLSKFHAAINQLRQTNEFSIVTLRELPKRCCTCPEKKKDGASTTIEPLLTSIDIDALRLICLQTDLKQYVAMNTLSSSSSKPLDYIILPFPILLEPQEQENISNQFIAQYQNQLDNLQKMHHVNFQFVTSKTPKELLNEIVHIKYNLVAKCSNYFEAIQAINGFYIIISAEDQSHIDLIKHALRKQWMRFMSNIIMYDTYTVYKWQQNLVPKIIKTKISRFKIAQIKYQKMLEKRKPKQILIIIARKEAKDEIEESDDYLVEDTQDTHPQLEFLSHKLQSYHKYRPSRIHRRQHIMALAIAA